MYMFVLQLNMLLDWEEKVQKNMHVYALINYNQASSSMLLASV